MMNLANIIIISVFLGSTLCSGLRIFAIFPVKGRSHFSVMEQVAKGLAEKGHQVDVISAFPLKEPFPNYTDIVKLPPTEALAEFKYDQFSERNAAVESLHGFIREMCNLVENPEIRNLIDNPPTDPPYDLVLTQFIAGYQCFTAIGHLWNVPVVGVVTTTIYPYLNHFIGDPLSLAIVPRNLRVYKDKMSFWDRLYNVVMTHYAIHEYYKYAHPNQEHLMEKLFGSRVPHYSELEKSVALMLTNSHYSLHGVKPKTPALIEIGGIHITEDKSEITLELKKLMDDSVNGFIYLSFGTLTAIESLPKEALQKFWVSFGKIKSIRIIMKAIDPQALPPGKPSNVFIFPWLPQRKILQHPNLKGFVSHGGGLGTQEAVYYGVPTICVPFFADQPVNCDISSIRGFGQKLDIFTAKQSEFDHVFNELLNNPSYKQAAKKLSVVYRDRPLKPKEEAAYWIEYVARHGKDVLRSRAVDLKWWQLELLDVYAFIVMSLLMATITVFYVIRKLFSFIRSLTKSIPKKYLSLSKKIN